MSLSSWLGARTSRGQFTGQARLRRCPTRARWCPTWLCQCQRAGVAVFAVWQTPPRVVGMWVSLPVRRHVTPFRPSRGQRCLALSCRHRLYAAGQANNPGRWPNGKTSNCDPITKMVLNPTKKSERQQTAQSKTYAHYLDIHQLAVKPTGCGVFCCVEAARGDRAGR